MAALFPVAGGHMNMAADRIRGADISRAYDTHARDGHVAEVVRRFDDTIQRWKRFGLARRGARGHRRRKTLDAKHHVEVVQRCHPSQQGLQARIVKPWRQRPGFVRRLEGSYHGPRYTRVVGLRVKGAIDADAIENAIDRDHLAVQRVHRAETKITGPLQFGDRRNAIVEALLYGREWIVLGQSRAHIEKSPFASLICATSLCCSRRKYKYPGGQRRHN